MSLDASMPTYLKAIINGLAGMVSTILIHPLDLIKVRIQLNLRHYTFLDMVRRIVSKDGYQSFYCGVSASLLRQAIYVPTRVVVYQHLLDAYTRKHNTEPSLARGVKFGVVAGLTGAFLSVPAEVASVRMIAMCTANLGTAVDPNDYVDPHLHANPYKGIWNALSRIATEEGFAGLWRGGTLTACRTVFVTAAHISCYMKSREKLMKRGFSNNFQVHLYAALVSSFVTAILSLPVDLVKTRYQVKREGVTAGQILLHVLSINPIHLWTGFSPYFARLMIHAIIYYSILDHMNLQYLKLQNPESPEEAEKESLRWE